MATNFVQDGTSIEFTNSTGSDIKSGDAVVVGSLVGIAVTDIPADETGTLLTEGVYQLPKVSADVIGQGEYVYLDSDGNITITSTDNSLAGKAWIDAVASTEEVHVKINA